MVIACPPWRPEDVRSTDDGRSGGNGGPARRRTSDHQCLNFVVQAIPKQNQNTQKKVPTTQPNPQYSAKNNVTMHMIDTFMPPPFHILACLKYSMIIFQQYLAKLYSNLSKYSCLFLIRFIYKNVCTNTYVWGKMTFILFVSV